MATQTAARGGAISAVADGPEDEKKGKKGAKGKDAKGGKKSKKKLIIIVLVLVIAVVGYMMLGKKKAKGPTAPQPGIVVAMNETTLNLADGHFLKIKLALQAIKGAPATLDVSQAMDLMISEFTGQSMSSLSTAGGRDKLKDDLLAKIEKAYPKEVMGLYFTEFVMQ